LYYCHTKHYKDVRLHHAHGFTLLELIITIVIISILAVLPFYNWPGTAINVNAQAKQFADDIRLTQSLSMSKAERYRIVKTSATTYQILNSADNPISFANGDTVMTLNSGLSFGVWTNLTNNLIAFDGKGIPYLDAATPGTALAVGTTYSIMINGSDSTATITITPITGRVLVQ
jgi:prepilin-type N-terminal cleavage/methylation domain-containing protein